MKEDEFARLESEFLGIRDEKGVHRNTAVRIGTAFLELLRYASIGEFEEISFKKVLNKPIFADGLISLGTIILGEYAEGLRGGIITPEGVAELKDLWVREHIKAGDGEIHHDEAGRVIPALEVLGDSTFTGSLSSPEFVSAFFGGLGWAIQRKEFVNAAGETEYKYTLEIDNAVIRNTLRVFELIISQLLGENGNRFFSDMMEVDHYDSETGRVYLKTGNGRLYNPFRVDDIIEVQQYNSDPTQENDWYVTKAYELHVTAVGVGNVEDGEDRLDWVEFSNFASQMEDATPEGCIKEFDTFVRVDNTSNAERKGMLTMMSVGSNTPYMDVLYGQKTDPTHALKARIGNLEGIRTREFGWLEGFGAYINNLYGVGKFFNHQTGESLTAHIEATEQHFKSLYTETQYVVSEEENYLTNGFFNQGLEDWAICDVNGDAAELEEPDEMLGMDDGLLLVNGAPMAVESKSVAEIKEVDGIKTLYLRGMGIRQSGALIKENSTHKESESEDDEILGTVDVPDTLYLGFRIQPITDGTLTVVFHKSPATSVRVEKELMASMDWELVQMQDFPEEPYEYNADGFFMFSYTGECYVRFVVLRNDPISSTKATYSTLIEQTSRQITLRAKKLSDDLTEAVAEINLRYDQITQTVTNNKSASDTAFETIQRKVDGIDSQVQANNEKWTNFATWKTQTDSSISSFAAALTVDGQIASLSEVIQTVDAITTRVTTVEGKASTNANNISSVTTRVGQLETTSSSITARVSTVESKATSIESDISGINSDISGLSSDISGINSEISSVKGRVSQLETTDSSISARVEAVELRSYDFTDIARWEQGKVETDTAGSTYSADKQASTTRIRTKDLIPCTLASAARLRAGYYLAFVFYTSAKKKCSSKKWSGWLVGGTDIIAANPPNDAAYMSVVIRRSSNGTIAASAVPETGISITSGVINSSGEIMVGVVKTEGGYISNAKISADNINFHFTNASSWYSGSTKVMEIDAEGDLWVKGHVVGVVTTNIAYSPVKYISAGSYTVNPASEPYHTFYCYGGGSTTITLPNATSYDGLELEFFTPFPTTRIAVDTMLKSSVSGQISCHDTSVDWDRSQLVTNYYTQLGRLIVVKSMNSKWHVVLNDW